MTFFPAAALEDDGIIGFRGICTRRADFDGGGDDNYIVAAYTNNAKGAVLVIRTDPSPIVVSSAGELEFYENYPFIAVPDLDSDGVPEIVVTYARVRYSSAWVFKWSEPELTTIGPMVSTPDGTVPDLDELDCEDLNGDGVEELIDIVESGTGEGTVNRVFSLVQESYSEVSTGYLWIGTYQGPEGSPVSLTDTFESGTGSATLRVVNRTEPGSQPITDGDVIFNGLTVATMSQLVGGYIEVPVSLNATNSLQVVLRDGDPESRVVVSIQKSMGSNPQSEKTVLAFGSSVTGVGASLTTGGKG